VRVVFLGNHTVGARGLSVLAGVALVIGGLTYYLLFKD